MLNSSNGLPEPVGVGGFGLLHQENNSNTLGMDGNSLEDDLAAILRWMVVTNRVGSAEMMQVGLKSLQAEYLRKRGALQICSCSPDEKREVLSQSLIRRAVGQPENTRNT